MSEGTSSFRKPEFKVWTIYECPTDYPGMFVVRGHAVRGGETFADPKPLCVVKLLTEARREIQKMNPGLVMVTRSPEDDLVIVESWL